MMDETTALALNEYESSLRAVENELAVILVVSRGEYKQVSKAYMRLSEILKLQYGDLIGNRLVLRRETTKSETSSRRVTVDEITLQHITEWMTYQAELLKSIGILQTDKTPLLCNARGNKLDKGKFENWWGQWRNDHGLDGLLFHELRHTQATLLLANGVDYRTVMERMGFAGPRS